VGCEKFHTITLLSNPGCGLAALEVGNAKITVVNVENAFY